jgi:C_GCAxxG_C_C family probable redox protein
MESNKELEEKIYRLAFKYEAELGSCPQCVLAAIKEVLDIGDEKVIKSSDGLAGGTALSSKGTCGALVGGILAIGFMVGRKYDDFKAGKRKRLVFKYTKLLYDRFVDKYGSSLCCEVQKKIFGKSYNLMDITEYKEFEAAGAHVDKCTSVAGNTARWTAEIILNEIKNPK